ncbi:MAG TPA: chromate transporter [Herpetosiphon sp.]|uniref:Chromate transporter, chromate ion transporter (CHR) family n=1 Tax=Herpetosiphon aurantiacus (strain ATCC 23779 / DSM 785 / 114-95) TaxID=316274 RepID=A9AUV7_HERA2|nr:chromate efflux transporter [Herpetosiphon sp.]ABX06545.1 chromate transporter, chromate ion transporter (CHR) family [Herpetosiphon aurantiacus DSM 785]HBW50213.1 chromate transporter [Herpetosiphon sp.]
MADAPGSVGPPQESYLRLFLRFLRFGLLAWGGPVAQIAMIRQELVEEEQWIEREHFNRVLAVYQALPGPEAHELCVYFGMVARGRIGAVLAGLGFMLPGFVLMLLLSWAYVAYGITAVGIGAILFGFKPAVAALIIRAVHRIGEHALTNRWLWAIALGAGIATLLRVHFIAILLLAGVMYWLLQKPQLGRTRLHSSWVPLLAVAILAAPSVLSLFGYGLRTGLLTFGGAYTAIPFLQHDAVTVGGWMTNEQFIDGVALSGILPAPLIIFSTFVGYLGGGFAGALALTAGTFLPAFLFTIVGHHWLERIIANAATHAFLDGITAAVVGLITVTTSQLIFDAWPREVAPAVLALAIAALSLWVLYRSKAKWVTAAVVLGSGALGLLSLLI